LATTTKNILLISDGNPGHYNQSVAVSEMLEPLLGAQTQWLEVRQKIPGILRRPFATFLNRFPSLDLADALKHRFDVQTLPESPPCLIVSSGGKTAFFNALAARHYGCPNIFLGDQPPLAARNFRLLVTTHADHGCNNYLQWDYLATRITPDEAAKQGADFRARHGYEGERLWTMLIGGNSRSHRYQTADWQRLAEAMNLLAARLNMRWLIATSRRTGSAAEQCLKSALAPSAVAEAAWWGDAQRKVIPAYLGAAEMVVCTQDSLSMITESVACATPAYVIYPQSVLIDPVADESYKEYLGRNTRLGRILRLPIVGLGTIEPEHDLETHFHPITRSLSEELLDRLLPRLREQAPELLQTVDRTQQC